MPMRVVIDGGRCQGHGQCAQIAPDVFALADDERAYVLVEDITDALHAAVDDAIVMCPEAAISYG